MLAQATVEDLLNTRGGHRSEGEVEWHVSPPL